MTCTAKLAARGPCNNILLVSFLANVSQCFLGSRNAPSIINYFIARRHDVSLSLSLPVSLTYLLACCFLACLLVCLLAYLMLTCCLFAYLLVCLLAGLLVVCLLSSFFLVACLLVCLLACLLVSWSPVWSKRVAGKYIFLPRSQDACMMPGAVKQACLFISVACTHMSTTHDNLLTHSLMLAFSGCMACCIRPTWTLPNHSISSASSLIVAPHVLTSLSVPAHGFLSKAIKINEKSLFLMFFGGPRRVPFWAPFWGHFWNSFWELIWRHFGTFLMPFWDAFWDAFCNLFSFVFSMQSK